MMIFLLGGRLGKRIKSRGPKTVPCGTPEATVIDEEETPSNTTSCVLIVKKNCIQLCRLSMKVI